MEAKGLDAKEVGCGRAWMPDTRANDCYLLNFGV